MKHFDKALFNIQLDSLLNRSKDEAISVRIDSRTKELLQQDAEQHSVHLSEHIRTILRIYVMSLQDS